ncbi:hypothetical protein CC78DRAFT_586509 [Lojkania enalia]|uniref:Uncharacterized protein n=1 Tax=Lojkania enalia TaxID=147567 RepID=A0A9P4N1P3_9PLEO|nr:hypothetical protein CC78DRAFT_586509 [Didymosphaeria enalia]
MAWKSWERNIYERDILRLRKPSQPSSATISSSSTSTSKKSKLRRGLSKLLPSRRKTSSNSNTGRSQTPPFPILPQIPGGVPDFSSTPFLPEKFKPEPEPIIPPTSPSSSSFSEPEMASPTPATVRYDDAQAQGKRRNLDDNSPGPNSVLYQPPGSLLKGATDENGDLKPAALMLGIKLDLEAEVHLTARVRGDITIGLY